MTDFACKLFKTNTVKGKVEHFDWHQNITVTQKGGTIAKLQKRWSLSNNLHGPQPCTRRQQKPGYNNFEAVIKNINRSIRTRS